MDPNKTTGAGTFRDDGGWNRRIFPDFDRERFPFYFNYLEYKPWPRKRAFVKIMDPMYRSVYIQIKYFKPVHPCGTHLLNMSWKEHLDSQKIVL